MTSENPTLSKEEELEIDEQLKQLNKPAVKTIKGNGGVIYDCVDFFKQPAFDHPLLKNHNYHYQMKPSSRPTEININENHNIHGKKEEKGLRCPTGTVPIRRTTKKDLIQSKLFAKTYSSRITPQTIEKPGLHHAVLRTKPGQRYNGGGVIMSIHNLSTIVSPQYSASQMTIKNGPDSIQVGWMVNPSLYGDSKTRLFTFFQAGGRSCFNTQCPGFVIVNTATPIDFVFNQISNRGDPAFITRFFVYRDAANGNWWLLVGTSGTEIGFWPGRIFSSLNTGLANYVEWGGEAYSPPGQPNTPMGNSFHPKGDTSFDSFMKQITTINESHKQVIATNTEVFADNKNLYSVRDWGLEGSSGHMMSFGGPFISAI